MGTAVQLAAAVALLLGTAATPAVPGGDPRSGGGANEGPSRPVVVELFTSQGCASCPPADRLLAKLRAGGAAVVPLAFHVDFWNSQGWTDPFSSAAWSRRQESYARALGTHLFTPQTVVDGRVSLVGADEAAWRAAVAATQQRAAAAIELALEPRGSEVRVHATVALPDSLLGRKLELMVAVYENGLTTAVVRGENGGRSLVNDHVVRSLRTAARLRGRGAARSEHSFVVPLAPEWSRADLGVAAFLQDPGSREIFGAASRALPAPTAAAAGAAP